MDKALSDRLLQSEISRRKLMQTGTAGGLALASGALSLPFAVPRIRMKLHHKQ